MCTPSSQTWLGERLLLRSNEKALRSNQPAEDKDGDLTVGFPEEDEVWDNENHWTVTISYTEKKRPADPPLCTSHAHAHTHTHTQRGYESSHLSHTFVLFSCQFSGRLRTTTGLIKALR